MTPKPEKIGFSDHGVVDHSACENRANAVAHAVQQPINSSHEALQLYTHDYDSNTLPDCSNCTDSCCANPHVTTLAQSDVKTLKQAGFVWAIAFPRPKSKDLHPSLKQIDGRCVFLKPDSSCAIYPIRPLVCRAFPLQVAEDDHTIRYASSCRSRGVNCSPQTLEEMAVYAVESFIQKSKSQGFVTSPEVSQAKPKVSFNEILSKKTEP